MAIDKNSDLEVLAATIAGEAEDQPLAAKQGVAAVAVKRAKIAAETGRKQFGDGTVRGACRAPWQFSCWNAGPNNKDRQRIEALDLDKPYAALQECMSVARSALDGTLIDPTSGATFYKNTDFPWPSEWGAELPALVTLGALSFYDLDSQGAIT